MTVKKPRQAVITGHTKGIGYGIAQALRARDYLVRGCSRSNGYDVEIDAQRIADEATECDLFVNNATNGFGQVEVLYSVFERLKNRDALIINISSNNTDGIRTKPHPHSAVKHALDKATEQLQYCDSRCRIVNVKLGYVDTDRVRMIDCEKMPVARVVDTLLWIIDQPDELYIRQIYLSPRHQEL